MIHSWFAKRPRWHVHFTPTSASWINQVERFFALLTERALRRGVFRSVADLEKAIKAYIEATNADPKPFRWTKTANDILASIQRFCLRTLGQTHRIKWTSESGHYNDGAAPEYVEFTCFSRLISCRAAGRRSDDRMVRIRANSMPSSFVQADLGNSAVVLDRSESARPII